MNVKITIEVDGQELTRVIEVDQIDESGIGLEFIGEQVEDMVVNLICKEEPKF